MCELHQQTLIKWEIDMNIAVESQLTSKPKRQKWLRAPSNREAEIRKMCVANGWLHILYGSPYVAIYFGLIALILLINNPWIDFLLALGLGNQLYVLFVLHHDCMHGSAFKSKWLNTLFGRLYALSFTMTFTTNRETHKRHHNFIADPERDPDEYYFSGKLNQIWLRIWRYYEWYTRISLTCYGQQVSWTVIIEQIVNLAFWVVIHAVLIYSGMGIKALFIFWIPLAFVALVINPITRGYEHAPLTLYKGDDPDKRDMQKNTITVDNFWLGLLWAGITYHVEHHAYPGCPFYRLRTLHEIFQAEKMQYYCASFPLYQIHKGAQLTEGLTCNQEPVQEVIV